MAESRTPEENLQERLRDAASALESYETHDSPYAVDWARVARELKHALEGLSEAITAILPVELEPEEALGMDSLYVPDTIIAVRGIRSELKAYVAHWPGRKAYYRDESGEWEELT